MSDNEPATRTPGPMSVLVTALQDVDEFFKDNDDFTDVGEFPIPDFIVDFRNALPQAIEAHDALIAALKSLLDVPWGPDTFAAAQDTFAKAEDAFAEAEDAFAKAEDAFANAQDAFANAQETLEGDGK